MAFQAWEYRVHRGELSQARLDGLGREGWELVAVGDQPGGTTAYLKRPALGFKERVTLEQRERYARSQGYELGS